VLSANCFAIAVLSLDSETKVTFQDKCGCIGRLNMSPVGGVRDHVV
jgi:hypothetical protein